MVGIIFDILKQTWVVSDTPVRYDLDRKEFGFQQKNRKFQKFGFRHCLVLDFIFDIIFAILKHYWNFFNTLVRPDLNRKENFNRKTGNLRSLATTNIEEMEFIVDICVPKCQLTIKAKYCIIGCQTMIERRVEKKNSFRFLLLRIVQKLNKSRSGIIMSSIIQVEYKK